VPTLTPLDECSNAAANRTPARDSPQPVRIQARVRVLACLARRSSARTRAPSSDQRRIVTQVEAMLWAFLPEWSQVAAPIPAGGSCGGQLHRLQQKGFRIAERGPLADDGGGYLYLLSNGTLAELEQWPIRLGESDGWFGLLQSIGIGAALAKYRELYPARLRRTLSKVLTMQPNPDPKGRSSRTCDPRG
jgi:hypothetical protein